MASNSKAKGFNAAKAAPEKDTKAPTKEAPAAAPEEAAEATMAAPQAEAQRTVIVRPPSAKRLNIREAPSLDAGILGKALNGQCLEVLDEQDGWLATPLGFVLKEFTEAS
ncbi:MAG: SH3 domain-containing protein [Coriobacteriaceae bacterium]|nr:SH3 domain-containing protein [Coriobacteriaceae bacterium]